MTHGDKDVTMKQLQCNIIILYFNLKKIRGSCLTAPLFPSLSPVDLP